MKKIEYQAPSMEIVELKYSQALLMASTDEVIGGGAKEVDDDATADQPAR